MDAEEQVFLYGNKKDYKKGKDKEFVPGAVANGIDEAVAKEIWGKMKTFAEYAFNRSHAACYAFIGYITAYLSCHYPAHFYAAMLNAFNSDADKSKEYLAQAKGRGIDLLPPDINLSEEGFTPVEGRNAIRFGIRGVTAVKKSASCIIEDRTLHGNFVSLSDFVTRAENHESKINKSGIQNLIFAGAFDGFGLNRRELVALYESLSSKSAPKMIAGQIQMFSTEEIMPKKPEYPKNELLEKEFEAIGTYISGHPAEEIRSLVRSRNVRNLYEIPDILSLSKSRYVSAVGVVKDYKIRFTRNAKIMVTFSLYDEFTKVKCVVFSDNADMARTVLSEGKAICVTGRFTKNEDFGDQIVVETVLDREHLVKEKEDCITVVLSSKADQTKLFSYADSHKGKTRVYLKKTGSDRVYKPKNLYIDLSPASMSFLKDNFSIIA